MKNPSVYCLARCAAIAALYTAISIALLPLSFGAVQARIAEALTLLPVLTPLAVPGVALGCLLTNAVGVAAGSNVLGAADIVLGSATTLFAALLTRRLRRLTVRGIPLLSSLPPVLLNALVIGGELTWAETGRLLSPVFWINFWQVGLGQLLSCSVLGLLLVAALQRGGCAASLFGENAEGER